MNLAITSCLVILFSTEETEGENNGCRSGSRGVYVLVWLSCSIHQHFVVKGLDLPEALCASTLLGHDTGWFIYLIIAQQAGMSPWSIAIVSQQPLSSTKQLEGQLCGDPSYSLSLSLLAFTLSLFLLPPYHLLSISPVALSITQCSNFSCPLYFSQFFPCCWSADANVVIDLRKFNLNNGSVPECICGH